MKKEFEIYTDGACIGNGQTENIGGWSFVFVQNNQVFFKAVGVQKNTTNNIQELTGVLNALRVCKEHNITDFTIYSDSQYVVNGFNSWMKNWVKKGWRLNQSTPVKNKDFWVELYELQKENPTIDLRWVRGHNGNKWNEFADQLIEKEMAKDPDFNNLSKKSYAHAKKPNNP